MRRIAAAAWLLAQAARAGAPGREAASFSTLAGDARGAALGSPAAALAEGESAQFGNPAALALEDEYVVGLTHLAWVEGFFGESFVAQMPVGHEGALGASGFAFLHDAIPVTSERLPDGTGADARMLFTSGALTMAQFATESLGAGASVRGVYEAVGDDTWLGMSVDLGLLWRLTPDVLLGASARRVGGVIESRRTRDPLPTSVDLGARWAPEDLLAIPLRVYAGGALAVHGPSRGGVAMEVGSFFGAYLRTMIEVVEFRGVAWAAGLGARRDLWQVDYALTPAGELGLAHRFALTLKFSPKRQRG